MLRIASLALLSAAIVAQAGSAADWKPIEKALESIPSHAGTSVLQRIHDCRFTIIRDTSFLETRQTPWPRYDAKAGETVLKVSVELPLYKGEPPADNKPLDAVWIIDNGKASALSHWANLLQNAAVPMGYDKRLNC